jgi:hypothetical protein
MWRFGRKVLQLPSLPRMRRDGCARLNHPRRAKPAQLLVLSCCALIVLYI